MIYVYIFLEAVCIYILYYSYCKTLSKKSNSVYLLFCLFAYLFYRHLIIAISYKMPSINATSAIIYGVFVLVLILKNVILSYIPKKSREIYDYIFVHRGFHFNVPENTMAAYGPVLGKFGIEMDVRYLKKDKNIICFHDRYTSRLLGIPGKTSNFTYNELRMNKYVGSDSKVLKLEKALKK